MKHSLDTLEKLRRGVYILCSCGNAHTGRHVVCLKCLYRTCEKCGKQFKKGESVKLCIKCTRSRIKTAARNL